MPLFRCPRGILLTKSTKTRPSASAPACAQLSDLCFAWWSSPPLLPGYRALFNSHCAPRAHNLLQKVSRFPDAMGKVSWDEAPYPAVQVFGEVLRSRPRRPLFQRFLQFPCLGTLRNRRYRHTPGTRHTRCLRAGRLYEPWGAYRWLPSFRDCLGEVLFAQDCSGLFNNLKRLFVESLACRANSSGLGGQNDSGRDLKSRQKWSYTECGPKKSDIRCSN